MKNKNDIHKEHQGATCATHIPFTRSFLILSLIAILIIGGTGCINIPLSDSAMKNELLTHLYEKYGVEFEPIKLVRGGGSNTLYCYPKGGCPEEDRIWVNKERVQGEMYFRDTYFTIIIREDLEAEVFAAISDLPLPKKVLLESDTLIFDPSNIFESTKTYADLMQAINDGNASARFSIAVAISADDLNESEREEYANQIFDRLEKDGFPGLVNILFYPSEAFEKITRSRESQDALFRQYRDQHTTIGRSIN